MALTTLGRGVHHITTEINGESEARPFWLSFLLSFKDRGFDGVKLVISDSHSGLKAAIQQVFVQSDEKSVHTTWQVVAHHLENRFPAVTEKMDEAEADVLAYFSFPKAHQAKLHSTNTLARLNSKQGGQASGGCGGHLPQRREYHAAARSGTGRAKRGMALSESLPVPAKHGRDKSG